MEANKNFQRLEMAQIDSNMVGILEFSIAGRTSIAGLV